MLSIAVYVTMAQRTILDPWISCVFISFAPWLMNKLQSKITAHIITVVRLHSNKHKVTLETYDFYTIILQYYFPSLQNPSLITSITFQPDLGMSHLRPSQPEWLTGRTWSPAQRDISNSRSWKSDVPHGWHAGQHDTTAILKPCGVCFCVHLYLRSSQQPKASPERRFSHTSCTCQRKT